MKRLLVATALAAVLVGGFAGHALASGAGAIDLTFPIGARYNALGEAGTALSQDATAMWWNCGGLAFLPLRPHPKDIHLMHSKLAEGLADDIGLTWLGMGMPVGDVGAIAFSINYLDMGSQMGINEDQEETGEFASYMFSVGAAYGVRIFRTLGVGLGIKYFRDDLAPDQTIQDGVAGGGSGDSFGVDLGVLWKVPQLKANFGLAVANLGPDITHVDAAQSDPMPRKMTVGGAVSLYNSEYAGLLAVFDYLVPLYKWKGNDYAFDLEFDQNEYGGGLEANYDHSLFLRFGYKSAKYGDIQDMTYGFGVDLEKWTNQAVIFDFASVPQAEGLPSVSRLSFGYRF